MVPILLSNDPVLLSLVETLLTEAGISFLQADRFTSAIEGSIGAIPRRIMVADHDEARARRCLGDAGLGAELESRS